MRLFSLSEKVMGKFERAFMNDMLISNETRQTLMTSKTELGAESYGYGFSVRRFDLPIFPSNVWMI